MRRLPAAATRRAWQRETDPHAVFAESSVRKPPEVSSSSAATAQAAFVSGYSLALLIGAGVMVAGAVLAAVALREHRPQLAQPALEATT